MRAGLCPGIEAEVTITVTADMVARFEELGLVHPVYATWSMIRHMELASRKAILPYLEPHEDAVGHSVQVTHRAPTPIGGVVTARARLTAIHGRQVTCEVLMHHAATLIGEGMTVQVVLSRDDLRARLDAVGAWWPPA